MRSPLAISILLIAMSGSPAAEETTSDFLKRCHESSCEHEVYLLLDGGPLLDGEYACLMAQDEPPLAS
jgi:hypothetical protein